MRLLAMIIWSGCLVGCQSEPTLLSPCHDFGHYCHQIPINTWS